MTDQTGWENLIDSDERIVWQGRPDAMVGRGKIPKFSLILGTGVCLFGVVFLSASEGRWEWIMGFLILLVGLSIIAEHPVTRPFLRSRTWHALTNKRAIIVNDWPILGRRLRSFPITAEMPLLLETRWKSGVHFATKRKRQRNAAGGKSHYNHHYGFELIRDAEHVYQLMLDMQANTVAS